MDNSGYIALTRQSGLMRELRVLSNNIANMHTTGFKEQDFTFSEFIKSGDISTPSLSMATGRSATPVMRQGTLEQTGGVFDVAIEGDGYFLIDAPNGERLTRAGHFVTDTTGQLVTQDGNAVLDPGGAPILIPADASALSVGADGTISSDGRPLGQIAVVSPRDPDAIQRESATLFSSDAGWDSVEAPLVRHGMLESSNVNVIEQMGRLVAVQRAYELGQSFMENEDQRIRNVIDTLGR